MITRLILGLVFFATLITTPAWGAISVFCITSSPVDNGSQTGLAERFVTPCPGMAANDYVILVASMVFGGANTLDLTSDGGQVWTSETEVDQAGGVLHTRIFHTRFDGTWTADPGVDTGGSASGHGLTLQMFVFRGVDESDALDVAVAGASFTAPSSPFNVTRTGVTTNTDNALVLAIWIAFEDQSWALQTAGWTASVPPYVRNLAGTDHSQGSAWMIQATAGATGNVVSREDQGSQAGVTYILALKEQAGGGVQPRSKVIFIQ